MNDQAVRELLAKLLSWEDSHAGFDAAVDGIPEQFRGTRAGAHSPWELIEHMRIAQHDILDFSRNRDYHEMEWPKEYWPKSPAPSSTAEWDVSIEEVPLYLVTQFGKLELRRVVGVIREETGLAEAHRVRLDTILYWIGFPASEIMDWFVRSREGFLRSLGEATA